MTILDLGVKRLGQRQGIRLGFDQAQVSLATARYSATTNPETDRTMDLSRQSHLPELRERLINRLRELREEIGAAAESARQQASAAAAHEVTDHKDEALQNQLTDLDDTQSQRDREELIDVEDALARLDAGAYGNCADCSCPIELPRLLVMPAARRCAACQSAYERTPKHSAVD